jgi:hypothetical protein
METERITLNQRERDRLRALHEIKGKHISQIEAAQRLKISDRHIRRLLIRLRKLGDRAEIGADANIRSHLQGSCWGASGVSYKYVIMIFRSSRPPENWNAAESNLGGPKCPRALFDAPTPSRGIPIKLVSSLPLEFSS